MKKLNEFGLMMNIVLNLRTYELEFIKRILLHLENDLLVNFLELLIDGFLKMAKRYLICILILLIQ